MESQQHSPRKRQKRYTRSRGGCFTCKSRKLKCDETKPTCQRCFIESRVCDGYGSSSKRTLSPRSIIDSPNGFQDIQAESTQFSQHTNHDAEVHQSFDSLLSSILNDVMDGDTSVDWMNAQPNRSSFGTNDVLLSTSDSNNTENLQQQLERLCTSQTQLLGVTHFFNHVVQCFHIIPAEANRWRIIFGSLSLQSEVIFRLVTSVGLISLSHHNQTNYRAIAYSHMTFSLRIWNQLVQEGKERGWQQTSKSKGGEMTFDEIDKVSRNVSEVLAIAILVAHVEQFDSGIAHESNKCLSVALNLVTTILQSAKIKDSVIDTSAGSHFRFLIRILLWWDIFSRTMGPGSNVCFEQIQEIISTIRTWEEEEEEESILDSNQCVTGWPIDLLEAISRTSKMESQLEGFKCDKVPSFQTLFCQRLRSNVSTSNMNDVDGETAKDMQSLLSEARAIETQIRSCRPKSIIQDSVSASELRFILFELLQASALIYFARVLSGNMDAVKEEILLILRFLNSSVLTQKTTSKREIPEWSNRWAADLHVIWAYLQASITAKPDQQKDCKTTLQMFNEVAYCGAMRVFLSLVEEIWMQRRTKEEEENPPYSLNTIWKDVIKQRRWRQLLIF